LKEGNEKEREKKKRSRSPPSNAITLSRIPMRRDVHRCIALHFISPFSALLVTCCDSIWRHTYYMQYRVDAQFSLHCTGTFPLILSFTIDPWPTNESMPLLIDLLSPFWVADSIMRRIVQINSTMIFFSISKGQAFHDYFHPITFPSLSKSHHIIGLFHIVSGFNLYYIYSCPRPLSIA
jgi:hypothetical protein